MTILGEDQNPRMGEDVFRHYGVKGMHWGARGAATTTYDTAQRNSDTQQFGKGGARRIAKRVDKKGLDLKTARAKENTYQVNRALLVAGAALAVKLATSQYVLDKGRMEGGYGKSRTEGQRLADHLFSQNNGIGSKHVIDLTFNPATKKYEH